MSSFTLILGPSTSPRCAGSELLERNRSTELKDAPLSISNPHSSQISASTHSPLSPPQVVRFCRRLHAAVTTPLPAAPRSAASSPTPPATIATKPQAPPAAPSGAGGPGVRPMGVGEKGVASVVYCWAPDHAHRRTNAAMLVAAYTVRWTTDWVKQEREGCTRVW